MRSLKRCYLIVVACQIAHSIEEYILEFYAWFPVLTGRLHAGIHWFPIITMPGRFFLTLNIALVVVMLALYVIIRRGSRAAFVIASVVAVIEMLNGVYHLTVSLILQTYFPGAVTGVLLSVAAIFLARVSFSRKPLVANARQ